MDFEEELWDGSHEMDYPDTKGTTFCKRCGWVYAYDKSDDAIKKPDTCVPNKAKAIKSCASCRDGFMIYYPFGKKYKSVLVKASNELLMCALVEGYNPLEQFDVKLALQ